MSFPHACTVTLKDKEIQTVLLAGIQHCLKKMDSRLRDFGNDIN